MLLHAELAHKSMKGNVYCRHIIKTLSMWDFDDTVVLVTRSFKYSVRPNSIQNSADLILPFVLALATLFTCIVTAQ